MPRLSPDERVRAPWPTIKPDDPRYEEMCERSGDWKHNQRDARADCDCETCMRMFNK